MGRLVGLRLAKIGVPSIVCTFGDEVSKRLPLPGDEALAATARGMQMTGIVLCVVNGRDLHRCACLIDLVKVEGQERLEALIVNAALDWTHLREIPLPGTAGDGGGAPAGQ